MLYWQHVNLHLLTFSTSLFLCDRIQQTAEDVYVLALSSFSVPSIIASCVCFLELLGVSNHKLRVDVSVANIILKNSTCNVEEAAHKSHTQDIGILLYSGEL